MAKFLGPPWGMIVCTEAAGNSATLSACTIPTPLHGEFVSGTTAGTFEFAHDIYIFAYHVFGDAANINRVTLRGTKSGGRYYIDSRENQPAETSTASAEGSVDLRGAQILIKAGDVCTVEWTEDASTNVEPCIIFYYSRQPFPRTIGSVRHSPTPAGAIDVALTQTSTTAATWTRSTNIMGPNNSDTMHFEEDSTYIICGMRSTGAATMKAAILEFPGMEAYPGIHGFTDANVSAIPSTITSEFFQCSPVSCTGKELNAMTTATLDIAGSETPTHVFTIRKQ